jgi:hypothetical protein
MLFCFVQRETCAQIGPSTSWSGDPRISRRWVMSIKIDLGKLLVKDDVQ